MEIYLLVCDPEKNKKGLAKEFSIRAYTSSARVREEYARRTEYNPMKFKYYIKKVEVDKSKS